MNNFNMGAAMLPVSKPYINIGENRRTYSLYVAELTLVEEGFFFEALEAIWLNV